MTEQEQIEEMRKEIENGFRKADCRQPYTNEPYPYFETQKTAIAKALYGAGYRKIDGLKAENKQLKTECALLDDELRIARQDTINVLNELKTKAFDKDAFNEWAGSTFVVLVRDIDKMIEELTKCQK